MIKRKSQAMDVQRLVKKAKLAPAMNVSVDLFADIDGVFDDLLDNEMMATTPAGSNSSSQTTSTIEGNTDLDSSDSMMDFEFDQIDTAVNRALNRKEDFLDLTAWRRCVVEECERDPKTHEIILRGREDAISDGSTASQQPMVCRLLDAWAHCKIRRNDIVSLLAAWNDAKHCYCVSSREGFAVVRPDFLVSGTSVVGGLFCLRKSILSDRFKGIDASSKLVSESSVIGIRNELSFSHRFIFYHFQMTVGSIVHELLQLVLRRNLKTLEEIRAVSVELLSDPQMAHTLYASQMSSDEARGEIDKFVDKIHAFVERFVNGRVDPVAKVNMSLFKKKKKKGSGVGVSNISESSIFRRTIISPAKSKASKTSKRTSGYRSWA